MEYEPMEPLIEQLPAVEPILTCTVGSPALTEDASLAAGVVNVALAPPVVESTLQLTVHWLAGAVH